MADGSTQHGDERFLLLAPTGRDAPLTVALLERAGIGCHACDDVEELCALFVREGAAGLMVAEEVLMGRAFARLCDALSHQETWSDLPVLLFTSVGSSLRSRQPDTKVLAPLGNVTLLERPLHPLTVLSAVRSAQRARSRQYSARAELVAREQAVRQRDQFLAMLGHELRNPLAAIALATSLEESAPARGRNVIQRQVQHLTRLVNDLLDVARVTTGKITLQRRALDLSELVREAADSMRPAIESQGLRLVVDANERLQVEVDAVRMEQALVNVLTNAAKYTPAGGSIEVKVDADARNACVHVCDTGVGIAPEMLGQVFDLFAQAEGSLDRSQGGLGIGLTLVRSVVELHGGAIEASSAGTGQGSTFRLRLPLCRQAVAADDELAPSASDTPNTRVSRDVLVIEDNPDSRELLELVLQRLGHRVHSAEDGPSGLAQALEHKPEVLLIDIGLPGLDGFTLCRRLREALPGAFLIALTGYGQPEDRRRAFEAGFDAHFTKPLDVGTIDALLKQPRRAAAADSGVPV